MLTGLGLRGKGEKGKFFVEIGEMVLFGLDAGLGFLKNFLVFFRFFVSVFWGFCSAFECS